MVSLRAWTAILTSYIKHPVAGFGLQGPEGWARRAPVEHLATARSDVDTLLAWLRRTYGPELLAALAFLPSEVQMRQDALLCVLSARVVLVCGSNRPAQV
jgi:hypothetical protein